MGFWGFGVLGFWGYKANNDFKNSEGVLK